MNSTATIKSIQCVQKLVIGTYILAKIKKFSHQSIKALNVKSKKRFMVPRFIIGLLYLEVLFLLQGSRLLLPERPSRTGALLNNFKRMKN